MSSSERTPTLAAPAPASEPSSEAVVANGPAHSMLFRRPGVVPSQTANPRDSARREWLLEHVAQRRARREATVALVRSNHLPDAAAADPQLQSELGRLLAFLKQAPGAADLEGADAAGIAASVRPQNR